MYLAATMQSAANARKYFGLDKNIVFLSLRIPAFCINYD